MEVPKKSSIVESSLEELKRVSTNELDLHGQVNTGGSAVSGNINNLSMSANNNGSGPVVPFLRLTRQEDVANELFARNGIQKQVHVVVKNINFQVELASNIDLSVCTALEAKLLYDFDKLEDPKVEVSYVKSQPLEYKVALSEGGTKSLVDIKIKVLTSQHEDMLFRVRFSAIDPISNMEFQAYSQSIKVISKLNQISKRKEGGQGPVTPQNSKRPKSESSNSINLPTTSTPISSQPIQMPISLNSIMNESINPNAHMNTNSLPLISNLSTSVEKIERNLFDQFKVMEAIRNVLIEQNPSNANSLKPSFESSARSMIGEYMKLTNEEKQERLNRFVNTLPQKEIECIFEIAENLNAISQRERKL